MTPLPEGSSLATFISEKQKEGKRVFLTSRSGIITHQRCPRKRYLEYHYEGTGITRVRLQAPLATGGYTHVALAELLRGKSAFDASGLAIQQYTQECVDRGLELEKTEDQLQVVKEQLGLVEAFTYLAARRVIPQLLEEYEIVDVEREEWFVLYEDSALVVVLEARCDALLRERAQPLGPTEQECIKVLPGPVPQGDLYVLSWKTAASWDRRKAKEARTDMQGLSEAYAVELRVAESTGEPVLGTKMIHLLKGKRIPTGYGDKLHYIQSSPLVHAWMQGSGPTPQFAWAYSWDDPEQVNDWGNPVSHKLGKGWRRVFIPDVMPVAEWVQMLDEEQVQPEAGDCLAKQFVSPMPEPRSPEQKQRWLRQIERQEIDVARAAEFLQQNPSTNEYDLDTYFPQYTHSCNYPSQCPFWEICHGSEEVDNPMSLYQVRVPHHPGESMLTGGEE